MPGREVEVDLDDIGVPTREVRTVGDMHRREMHRTTVWLTALLRTRIKYVAAQTGLGEGEVMRRLLTVGLTEWRKTHELPTRVA